jgi:hypothetical protein
MHLVSILVFIFLISSCYSIEHIPDKRVVTTLKEIPCDSSKKNIQQFTYFLGEKLDFDYTPIALLNFANGNHSSTDLYYAIRDASYNLCADGLINLTHSLAEGKYQYTTYNYDNGSRESIESRTYPIKNYSGMAVKLLNDSSRYRIDSNYISTKQAIKERNEKKLSAMNTSEVENKRKPGSILLIILGFTLFFFGVIVYD